MNKALEEQRFFAVLLPSLIREHSTESALAPGPGKDPIGGGGIWTGTRKRFSDTLKPGEVDFKTKAGTAWSHSYLNQKPWHPLSYPNQRRKWIAEQTNAHHQRRSEEVAREYAQEQEFFRQTALISNKEKEKVEIMKAVSFMYVRPPGYDVESAKAAEVSDEMRRQGQGSISQEQSVDGGSTSMQPSELLPAIDSMAEVKKKRRPKDVFGRALPTEEEFEVLKNAPRLETGLPARSKPFGVEVRNVRCLRCGNFGHQSGDRECPLKDVIMPNEENRLKRDDPLTAIMAHTDPTEPLKWELKQKPGMSPPRGGFDLNDPNQQIVAEDIFDEYGGFLSGGDIPDLLTNFSNKPKKRKYSEKTKHKRQPSPSDNLRTAQDGKLDSTDDEMGSKREKRHKEKKQKESDLNKSVDSESYRHNRKNGIQHSYSSDDSEFDQRLENRKHREKHLHSSEELDSEDQQNDRRNRERNVRSYSSEDSDSNGQNSDRTSRKRGIKSRSTGVSDFREQDKFKCVKRNTNSFPLEASDSEVWYMNRRSRKKDQCPPTYEDSDYGSRHRSQRSRRRDVHSRPSEVSDSERQLKDRNRGRNLYSTNENIAGHHQSSRDKGSNLSDDYGSGGHCRKENSRQKYSSDSDDSRMHRHHSSRGAREKRFSSEDYFDGHHKSRKNRPKHSDYQSYEDSRRHGDPKRNHHHRL